MEQHLLSKANATAYGIQEPPPPPSEWDAPATLPTSEAPAVDAITGRRDGRPRRDNATRKGTRAETRLCIPHFRYGAQAFSCQGGQCLMGNTPLARRQQAQGNGPAGR